MKPVAALIFCAFLVVTACDTVPSTVEDLTFERQDMVRQSGDGSAESTHVASVSLSWPRASGGRASVADSLNARTDDFIVTQLAGFVPKGDTLAADPETLIRAFLDEYMRFRKAFPESAQIWEIKITGAAAFVSEKAVTLKFEVFAFTGGAHPNSEVRYMSFDAESGKMFALEDVISDVGELLRRAEPVFRKTREIPEGKDFADAGFWFEDNRFSLPENFGLIESGLVFYWNYYEIGPRVVGPTEITIPYDEIGDLIR